MTKDTKNLNKFSLPGYSRYDASYNNSGLDQTSYSNSLK